jgi:hypothetical protein
MDARHQSILGWQRGRQVDPHDLRGVFRHLQFGRSANRLGNVSIQRLYIYAERGLAKRRVAVCIYEDRLHVEYHQTLLARYACRLDRQQRTLRKVSDPNLFSTVFASPQLEIIELDDEQWHKVFHRPPYAPRKHAQSLVEQLALF